MHRTLIVAKIAPGSQKEVARIFAESDATGLPQAAGVMHRSLYSLGDLYAHLVETVDNGGQAVEKVREHEEFRRVSECLQQYIQPYLPTWRQPRDAMAQCFYTYEPASHGEVA